MSRVPSTCSSRCCPATTRWRRNSFGSWCPRRRSGAPASPPWGRRHGEDARAPPCSPPRAPSLGPRRLGHPALPPVPSCTKGSLLELGLDKNELSSLCRTPPAEMLVRRCSGQHRPQTQESGSCHLPPAAPWLGHRPFVKHEVRDAAGVELDFGPELDMDDAYHAFDEMPAW